MNLLFIQISNLAAEHGPVRVGAVTNGVCFEVRNEKDQVARCLILSDVSDEYAATEIRKWRQELKK